MTENLKLGDFASWSEKEIISLLSEAPAKERKLNEALDRIRQLEQINATLMGDDETVPRYTTKRLRAEIDKATLDANLRIRQLEEALRDLLTACEDDFGTVATLTEFDADDEAVGGGVNADGTPNPMSITFGHMRRARRALEAKP